MNKELLMQIIREYYDGLATKPMPEYLRSERCDEVVALCIELELDNEFIETLKNDNK